MRNKLNLFIHAFIWHNSGKPVAKKELYMKNLILISLVCITFNAYSSFPGEYAAFEVRTQKGLITVMVDNNYYNMPTAAFKLQNITPGKHYVEIFAGRRILFSAKVDFYGGAKTLAKIDRNGRFYIENVIYKQDPYPAYSEYSPYALQNNYAPLGMSNYQFNALLDVIDKQWSDRDKVNVAMQAMQANYVSSLQVKEMMKKMWNEDSRLELAEAAYPYVIDKQNFFIVNDTFWYADSVQELTEYIAGYLR